MSGEKRNLPASVHQRLLNRSRESGRPFNELLQYYGVERFLYRLSASRYADKFILKGALMFKAWGMENLRPTRDIDLLGRAPNSIESIAEICGEICALPAEDGMEFDPSARYEPIIENAAYAGVRMTTNAYLGKIKFPIQVDIGFADVVTPAPEKLEYPVLLDFPAPRLYGYPPPTILAEKIQSMTALGMANSRMKDFYDVWRILQRFELGGAVVQTALERTFANRNAAFPRKTILFFQAFL